MPTNWSNCGLVCSLFMGDGIMTEKYEIIRDFCDWLGCQGIAYETIYYGTDKDIDNLIKRYLEDEDWPERKGEYLND